jgi:hypothetical protein
MFGLDSGTRVDCEATAYCEARRVDIELGLSGLPESWQSWQSKGIPTGYR